jgi:GH24 family phage-related lysozyme (muramidase)
MTFNYNGADTNFVDIFYDYASNREGYRNNVYKDIYGNLTVGIGHLVTASDNLQYGQNITDAQVEALFDADYAKLNIDSYVSEAAQNYNQGLAIAHFIWGHGEGQYMDSDLRQHLIDNDLDYDQMIAYLNSNWDVGKPSNQKVNDYDFGVYYSSNPWVPGRSLNYYLSRLQSFVGTSINNVHDYAKNNPTDAALILISTTIAMTGYIWYLIKRNKTK